jgi:hypothetical protein
MNIIKVQFRGIDYMGRACFRSKNGEYYGSTDIIFNQHDSEGYVRECVKAEDMVWLGNSFGCEPMGTPLPEGYKLQIEDGNG